MVFSKAERMGRGARLARAMFAMPRPARVPSPRMLCSPRKLLLGSKSLFSLSPFSSFPPPFFPLSFLPPPVLPVDSGSLWNVLFLKICQPSSKKDGQRADNHLKAVTVALIKELTFFSKQRMLNRLRTAVALAMLNSQSPNRPRMLV